MESPKARTRSGRPPAAVVVVIEPGAVVLVVVARRLGAVGSAVVVVACAPAPLAPVRATRATSTATSRAPPRARSGGRAVRGGREVPGPGMAATLLKALRR